MECGKSKYIKNFRRLICGMRAPRCKEYEAKDE